MYHRLMQWMVGFFKIIILLKLIELIFIGLSKNNNNNNNKRLIYKIKIRISFYIYLDSFALNETREYTTFED